MNEEFTIQFDFQSCSVVIENDCTSVWAYQITSKEQDVAKDAFVISPIAPKEEFDYQSIKAGNPPKLVTKFASNRAYNESFNESDFSVSESKNKDICIYFKNEPFAAIYADEPRSYSKSLSAVCGFGNPWSEKLYVSAFMQGS
ncbi:hypothetical protein PESP_b0649 [Pseudoalteromonas espejiana DSM 9414]|uniref:Uncharacterized protein n=1 Tax=Pseudoalteromonas espejiana TaxID=28107 RepID=A0A510XRE6_9GAMM|nr:hypothetical protein [Pseudoalteromonas espejiana]ASM52179.1 hypothetical protein PESP_b0649 [Pseudoalteromonas espejiana DSM 9414]GEK53596.1 hypothetical protein PES01_04410 [Pseudoalteromonas espejiana]